MHRGVALLTIGAVLAAALAGCTGGARTVRPSPSTLVQSASGRPVTSPSGQASTPVSASGFPTPAGSTILSRTDGRGSAWLVIVPGTGALHVVVRCPTGVGLTFVRSPDINVDLTCDGQASGIDVPDPKLSSSFLTLTAQANVAWTVAVGQDAEN